MKEKAIGFGNKGVLLIFFEGNLFSLWNRLKLISEVKYLVLIFKIVFFMKGKKNV